MTGAVPCHEPEANEARSQPTPHRSNQSDNAAPCGYAALGWSASTWRLQIGLNNLPETTSTPATQPLSKRPLSEEYPELHHYTDWNGLEGILTSRTLLATLFSQFNDYTEITHLEEFLADAVSGKLEEYSNFRCLTDRDFRNEMSRMGNIREACKQDAKNAVASLYDVTFRGRTIDEEKGCKLSWSHLLLRFAAMVRTPHTNQTTDSSVNGTGMAVMKDMRSSSIRKRLKNDYSRGRKSTVIITLVLAR